MTRGKPQPTEFDYDISEVERLTNKKKKKNDFLIPPNQIYSIQIRSIQCSTCNMCIYMIYIYDIYIYISYIYHICIYIIYIHIYIIIYNYI